jgi:hypothetical protein
MANVKISALPLTTTTSLDDFLVKNNSTETTTNKVQVKNTLGLTNGTGADSIKSASFLSTTPATSTGQSSVAIGDDSEANADYSTAYGYRAEVFDSVRVYGTAVGSYSRVAQYSSAFGYNSQGLGAFSVGVGGGQATGGSDIAIGRSCISQGQGAVAIGYTAQALNEKSVAIGQGAVADLNNSVAIGYNINTKFSGATAVAGLDTTGNVTDTPFITSVSSGSFSCNFNTASTQKFVLNQSSTINLIELRNGGRYRILFENTANYNITGITATMEGGVSANIYYNAGGRANLTHNSEDIWYVDVIQGKVYVTQFANYTL